MMTPVEVQTPMWPTKGRSQLMRGIGVQTMQVGNVVGGMTLPFSIMNNLVNLYPQAVGSLGIPLIALQVILACVL